MDAVVYDMLGVLRYHIFRDRLCLRSVVLAMQYTMRVILAGGYGTFDRHQYHTYGRLLGTDEAVKEVEQVEKVAINCLLPALQLSPLDG